MLFKIGKVKVSQAVLESDISVSDLISAFARYIRGDWGDGDAVNELHNDVAIACGLPIFATYTSADGQTFCMSTANGITNICLPEEVHTEHLSVFNQIS
jgi:hypothetical protein